MAERRLWFMENSDDLRTLLMYEPRGHASMSGAILQPPTRPDADYGVLFIEVSGLLPMCGHGTMGVATVLVETGMVPVTEPVTTIRLEVPAGLVVAEVAVSDGHATSVTLRMVPSFSLALDQHVQVPGFGAVGYDIAYGGNFYAIVELESLGLPFDRAREGPAARRRTGDHGRHQRAEPSRSPGAPRHHRLSPRLPRRPRLDGAALAPRDGDPPRLVRPVPLRDRHLRPDGPAARAWRTGDRRVSS